MPLWPVQGRKRLADIAKSSLFGSDRIEAVLEHLAIAGKREIVKNMDRPRWYLPRFTDTIGHDVESIPQKVSKRM